jgi:peroxiredoxin
MAVTSSETKPFGWEAVNFNLEGIDDRYHSLSEFKDKQGLLVVFTCNHCPYAQATWPTINALYENYHQELGFIAINPNDDMMYPEDSFGQMIVHAKHWDIKMPYVRDESQDVARAYDARCTPDNYLFKNEGGRFVLYYRGRVNDNWKDPTAVTENSLDNAIQNLLNNKKSPSPQFPSTGCSIKWKS